MDLCKNLIRIMMLFLCSIFALCFAPLVANATAIVHDYSLVDVEVTGSPIFFDPLSDNIALEIVFEDGDEDGWIDIFNPEDGIFISTQFDVFDLSNQALKTDDLIQFDSSISVDAISNSYWEGLSTSPEIHNCVSLHIGGGGFLAYVPDNYNPMNPSYTISGNLVQVVPEPSAMSLFLLGSLIATLLSNGRVAKDD